MLPQFLHHSVKTDDRDDLEVALNPACEFMDKLRQTIKGFCPVISNTPIDAVSVTVSFINAIDEEVLHHRTFCTSVTDDNQRMVSQQMD